MKVWWVNPIFQQHLFSTHTFNLDKSKILWLGKELQVKPKVMDFLVGLYIILHALLIFFFFFPFFSLLFIY